jgi:hypothetical protein
MNDPRRIELQDRTIKTRPSPSLRNRKVAIGSLAALIVATMIVWFAFLGWGALATLRWLVACIKTFWTTQ